MCTHWQLFVATPWLVILLACPPSEPSSDSGSGADSGVSDVGVGQDAAVVDATTDALGLPDSAGFDTLDAAGADSGEGDSAIPDVVVVSDATATPDTMAAPDGMVHPDAMAIPDSTVTPDLAAVDSNPLGDGGVLDSVVDAGTTDSGTTDSGMADSSAAQGITCDPPQTIDGFDRDPNAAQFPAISYSGDHAVAIWAERVGPSSYEGVALAYYNFASGTWSQPVDVFSEENPGFTPTYDVAVDADGDITALWREVRGGVYSFWARIYDATLQSWGDPEEVAGGLGQIHDYFLEYDRSTGQPMLVFVTSSNSRGSVYFTRRGTTGWSLPALLENNDSDHVNQLTFVVNDVGQGAVTWVMDIADTPTYFVLPYSGGDFRRNPNNNEFEPLVFVADSVYFGSWPKTAINDSGVGILVTNDSYASDRELLGVSLFAMGDALGSPTAFHTGVSPMSIGLGQVAMGNSGRGAVVWGQTDSFNLPSQPWVSIFEAGVWSQPEKVGTLAIGTSGPKIAIDGAGRVTVIWTSGYNGVVATRNTGVGGSFLPQQELTGAVTSSGEVVIAPHASGDFLAIWHEYLDIRAMRCR